jgi:hypothetical protein
LAFDEAVGDAGLAPHVVRGLDGHDLWLGVFQARDLRVERIDERLGQVEGDVHGLTRERGVVCAVLADATAAAEAGHGVALVEAHELDRLVLAFQRAAAAGIALGRERLLALTGRLPVPAAGAVAVEGAHQFEAAPRALPPHASSQPCRSTSARWRARAA